MPIEYSTLLCHFCYNSITRSLVSFGEYPRRTCATGVTVFVLLSIYVLVLRMCSKKREGKEGKGLLPPSTGPGWNAAVGDKYTLVTTAAWLPCDVTCCALMVAINLGRGHSL